MARAFATASSQSLSKTSAVISTTPITMACWAFVNNLTAGHALMCLASSSADNPFYILDARGDVANDPLRASQRDDAGTSGTSSTNNYPEDTWFHAAAVFSGVSSRTVYLNGVAGAENTSTLSTTTIDRSSIGAFIRLTPGLYVDGMIAEAAFWDFALTAGEIAALAKGVSPILIRPNNLLSYADLVRSGTAGTDAVDKVRSAVWTQTNSPAIAAHPRIMYPHRRTVRRFTTAVVAGGAAIGIGHLESLRVNRRSLVA